MGNPMLDTGDDSGGFGGSFSKNREPRWDEKIAWFNLPDDSFPYEYRLIGKPTVFLNHWVQTRKRDGTSGKPLAVLCKNYDSRAGKFVDNGCRICEYYRNMQKTYGEAKLEFEKWPDKVKRMQARPTMAINAIIRDLQAQGGPPNAKDWTFVAPIKLPKGFSELLIEKAQKYNRKPGAQKEDPNGWWGFNHAEHGRNLKIAYNSQADASKMYDLELGDKSPLTPQELEHARFMVDFASHLKYMDDSKADEILERNGYYELLQSVQAEAALAKAQSKVGLTTSAKPVVQEVPRQEVATTSSIPAALEVDDDGGMSSAAEVEVPSAATQAAHSTQAEKPAASPVQAPVNTTSADPIVAYATTHGKAIKKVETDYSALSLRTVKVGASVPVCFSTYSASRAENPTVCKGCPIKLDCMQVEGE